MSADDRPTRRRHGRALEQAILDAAWAELLEVGHANVTISAVAARAGTSKPVLYRRWPDREALLADTIKQRVPDLGPTPPDTGDLRDDVIAVLTTLAERHQTLNHTYGLHPAVTRQAQHQARDTAIQQMHAVLAQAHQPGQAPVTVGPWVIRAPIDVLHAELDFRSAPDRMTIEDIVDAIFMPLITPNSGGEGEVAGQG